MSVQSPRRNPVPFGTYLLLDRINIGGMAEVWRGKSFGAEGFERLVAIKRILPNIAEEADFKSMFIDEAKLSVLLSHANIAQVYELGELHGSLYIAMEYVAGKDLRFVFERSRKQQDPLPIPLVCHVIQRAAEGLDHAHRKRDQAGRELNIVHRDVSPQNILLSYDGEVKVIDFGIAKAAGWGTNTQTGVLKGKFGYMSPEQVMGEKVDRRSDVFALGVCLYELLTGERLFQGESDFSVLEKVANVDVQPARPSLQGLPADLARIVTRALTRSPEDRYPYASDLADDLERYLHASGRYFGRKDLMGFMHDAFGEDIDKELARQKDYAAIGATPEILEELGRGRSPKPQRAARSRTGEVPLGAVRSRTGEVPLALPPVDAALPDSQQTAAGSSRGLRARAMRANTEAQAPVEQASATFEATHPGAEGLEAEAAEVTGTHSQGLSQATHIGPAPSASGASVLHLDTHVGRREEPQVDVELVSASTQVSPAPVRTPARIADSDTRIGPAPKAPGPTPAPREVHRRSPTVGMPIPGILSMETHVGAAPLPPASASEPSEDSTTGSGGDPRREEPRHRFQDEAVSEPSAGDAELQGGEHPGTDEAATLAIPSRLTLDEPAATLATPSRLAVEETLSTPSSLTEEGPDVTRPPSRMRAPGARAGVTSPPPPDPEVPADTLATPSRITEDTAASHQVATGRPSARDGGRATAAESPARRRVRREDAELGGPHPVSTPPLPSDLQDVTDAAHRRPGKVAEYGREEAGHAEEDTDAGRLYAQLPEEDTDAGPHARASGAAPRAGRMRSGRAGAAGSDADEEADEVEDDASEDGASGAPEEDWDDDADPSDEEDPATFSRPQKAGRVRPLPIGTTRFDGLFDAKARRFTRRDLWLAGLAGAALSLVLTLLVSLVSGPTGTGMILVEVVGVSPSKTTVRLQGKTLPAALQFPVRATAPLGEVEVELSAEGYRPAKHLVRLTQPGEVAELRTSLEPL